VTWLLLLIPALLPLVGAGAGSGDPAASDPAETQAARHPSALEEQFLADQVPPFALQAMTATPCVGGFAGIYPCNNVDLMSFLPLAEIGGGSGNDIWGWTDPADGREIALMGLTNGTSFVDVSDPENPVYLGKLPTHTSNSLWRDIKVYRDHAFIVSEAANHGVQIFDLTQLRDVTSPPVTFAETAHYAGIGSAHNIAINEDTGFAYVVGSSDCAGGPHVVDVRVPASPVFAGCVAGDGYSHDTHCVTYLGPDLAHQGQEICFSANEDTLTIVDVTSKSSPVQLSRSPYSGVGYTHQGWLTENHQYFVLGDELDEIDFGHNSRTRIWDVSDLESPFVVRTHDGPSPAIDHNYYFRVKFVYQSNYRSGLRVLYMVNPATTVPVEVGFFDIYPADDAPNFNGAWSNYPFFPSGNVIVSGIEQGLFVLKPQIPTPLCEVTTSQSTYGDGEQIRLATASYSNASGAPLATRLQLELRFGTAFTATLIDVGADGTLEMPDGFALDLGPIGLFSVPASLPRGAWSFRCSLEDPDTGFLQSEDVALFRVE